MDTDTGLAIGVIIFLVCIIMFIMIWQFYLIFNNRNNYTEVQN